MTTIHVQPIGERTRRQRLGRGNEDPWSDDGVRHSVRFRQVSNRYPRRVWEAYDGDLRRAMADSDEEVAATVAAWERDHGLVPRDWVAIGRAERSDDED